VALRIPDPGRKTLIQPSRRTKIFHRQRFIFSPSPPRAFTAHQLIEMRTADLIVRNPQPFFSILFLFLAPILFIIPAKLLMTVKAGPAAGFTVCLAFHPFDTLKTRVQSPAFRKLAAQSARPRKMWLRGLYQGIGPVTLAMMPGCMFTHTAPVGGFTISSFPFLTAVASGCILHILRNLKNVSANLCTANPRADDTRLLFVPGGGPWVRGGYPC